MKFNVFDNDEFVVRFSHQEVTCGRYTKCTIEHANIGG